MARFKSVWGVVFAIASLAFVETSATPVLASAVNVPVDVLGIIDVPAESCSNPLAAALMTANMNGFTVVNVGAGTCVLSATTAPFELTGPNVIVRGQGNATRFVVQPGHIGLVFALKGSRQQLRDFQITYHPNITTTTTDNPIAIDGVTVGATDYLVENIALLGAPGILTVGATFKPSRGLVQNINGSGWRADLGLKALDLRRWVDLTMRDVYLVGTSPGTSTTRALSMIPQALSDTLNLYKVVIWTAGGSQVGVTADFSTADLANTWIADSVFDSNLSRGFEIISSGTTATQLTMFHVTGTRIANAGGTALYVGLMNPNARFKSVVFDNVWLTYRTKGGSAAIFDAASVGLMRSFRLSNSTIADAVPAGTPHAVAVLLGMDNIQAVGNTLISANESSPAGTSNTSYFFKATRANLRNMLIGNLATITLGKGFLDESAFTLGAGRVVESNYP